MTRPKNRYQVLADAEGWNGTREELADTLARRSRANAATIALELTRGEVIVADGLTADAANRVASELQIIGVTVRIATVAQVSEDAPSAAESGFGGSVASPSGSPSSVGSASSSEPPYRSLTPKGFATLDGERDAHSDAGGPEDVPAAHAVAVDAAAADVPRAPARSGWASVLGNLLDDDTPATASDDRPAKSGATGSAITSRSSSAGPQVAAQQKAAQSNDAEAGHPPTEHPWADAGSDTKSPLPTAGAASHAPATLNASPSPRHPAKETDATPSSDDPSRSALPVAGVYKGGSSGPQSFGKVFTTAQPTTLLDSRAEQSLARTNAHNPKVAAALSAVAPGAGQVFNGEPTRGAAYLLGSLLIVGWPLSIVDAYRRAAQIRAGQVREQDANPRHIIAWVAGVWALAVVMIISIVAIQNARARRAESLAEQLAAVAIDTGESTDLIENTSAEDDANNDPEVDSVPDPEERRLAARPLVRQARQACRDGRYEVGLELAEQALRLDDGNAEAQIVFAECSAGQQANSEP